GEPEKLGSKSGSICDSYFMCGGSAPLPAERTLGSRLSLNNSFKVKSLPGSVLRMNWSRMSSVEREEGPRSQDGNVLRVPGLRLNSTGSSSDDNMSSYDNVPNSCDIPVEMASMALLGVPGAAPRGARIIKPHMQLGGIDWDSDHATAEWVQTIDINVIQPTPNISPCGSVRSISDDMPRLTLPGRGRAISVLSLDSPEYDSHSIGSDSVFMEDSIFETSVTESFESGTTPISASPRSASPRQAARQVHTFRLAINPNAASPIHGHGAKSRKLTRHTLQPQDSLNLPSISKVPKTGSTLAIPAMGVNLSTSCERLAVHGSLVQESISSSRNTLYLMPSLSIEDEPQCSSYKVPTLRRCNSATTPGLKEEAAEALAAGKASYQRSDSAQQPIRRADSACGGRRTSNGSSSDSDDATESVSFHLMVPQLSVDVPSTETSRIESSPSPSPPPLPPDEPGSSLLELPKVRVNRSPSPSRGLRIGPKGRVLQRQFSQCGPSPSPVRDLPLPHCSLPTYVEEEEESPHKLKFPPLDLPFPRPPAEFQDPNDPSPPSQFKDPKDASPPAQFKDNPENSNDQSTPTHSVME
ncbi:unnamed protein product, partial [Meganyctiphanes norvegica]